MSSFLPNRLIEELLKEDEFQGLSEEEKAKIKEQFLSKGIMEEQYLEAYRKAFEKVKNRLTPKLKPIGR